MKNRKIKIISFTLCLILCLSSIPAFAVSAVEQRKELLSQLMKLRTTIF